eukprot:jgi/Botrbrau1/6786/Bobra.0057s0022.1
MRNCGSQCHKSFDFMASSTVPPSRLMLNGPPRPKRRHRIKKFVASSSFQGGLQLAVGMFSISLFSLVQVMQYRNSCLIATLFLVGSMLMVQSNHVGDKVTAATSLVGPVLIGSLTAGILVTISKLAGLGETAVLCVLAVLGLALMASIRACANPAIGMGQGITIMLMYGVTVLRGQFVSIPLLWSQGVAPILLTGIIAAAATFLTGFFVLPTLASDEVRSTVGSVIIHLGHNLSGYSTKLLGKSSGEGVTAEEDLHFGGLTVDTEEGNRYLPQSAAVPYKSRSPTIKIGARQISRTRDNHRMAGEAQPGSHAHAPGFCGAALDAEGDNGGPSVGPPDLCS